MKNAKLRKFIKQKPLIMFHYQSNSKYPISVPSCLAARFDYNLFSCLIWKELKFVYSKNILTNDEKFHSLDRWYCNEQSVNNRVIITQNAFLSVVCCITFVHICLKDYNRRVVNVVTFYDVVCFRKYFVIVVIGARETSRELYMYSNFRKCLYSQY